MDFLNLEIDYKIKEILGTAKKLMRISKRKTMKSDDINHALSMLNFKRIIGYDSYATVDYEKIENFKGLWRQKQNIIDIEDYLSKPIVSCPMEVFPHFHWLVLDGKRPNIPENFIKETTVTVKHPKEIQNSVPSNTMQKQSISLANIQSFIDYDQNKHQAQQMVMTNSSMGGMNEKVSVVAPIIHNISKELQIFLENFEIRLRKEIKLSKMNINVDKSLTKELNISLNVIRNEPGVVELLPYFLELLMTTFANKQNLKEPKTQLIIVNVLQAILSSPYYNIPPYLHQIVKLNLSILLLNIDNRFTDLVVELKNEAVSCFLLIYQNFQNDYKEFSKQILALIVKNIEVDKDKPRLLTLYTCLRVSLYI